MSVPTPPLYQCATCRKGASVNPRNLVVFIDGTSNKPGGKNTNVFKLFTDVTLPGANGPEVEQHKCYKRGIGAHYTGHLSPLGRMRKDISSGFEMAFARNVGENVEEAYGWLVNTYQEGDRIYLFGFSRGAYQVRALASMIHEVGLAKEEEDCETAYEHYLSIDFYKPHARPLINQFRTEFCWPGVRVHFIGVWDTVSSIGLVKKDVHVTASASVTNACHFRHALSLDELRVKFIPEYFGELNAHRSNIRSPRLAISNVKEVWFAGSHSDVGGVNRKRDPTVAYYGGDDPGVTSSSYAGSVTLEWMRKEAATSGLVFKSREVAWDPQDVLGTKESMTPRWRILEVFPIRHQISFSGIGEHSSRWHLCRPRSIIPSQRIHPSVFSTDVYMPHAVLGNSARNSIVLRRPPDLLDTIAPLDERARTRLLESLLKDPQTALGSLEKVLFLIDCLSHVYEAPDNEQAKRKPRPQWILSDSQGSPFTNFALTVIHEATSKVAVSEKLLNNARNSLYTVLRSSHEHSEFTQALHVLRFSAKHPRLRHRFVDDDVTGALMVSLERISRGPSASEIQFLLVTDSLCYLIADGKLSGGVINWFRATPETAQARISLILDVKVPIHLMASLKLIACLAQATQPLYPDLFEGFKSKLYELGKKKRDGVGSAAVKALVAMNAPQATRDIYIGNILGYLGDILPPLEVEVDSPLSPDDTDELPTVRWVNDTGVLNKEFMSQLVSTISSRNVHERTHATLTLVKLCRDAKVRRFCAENKVMDVFVKQLGEKKTSLLAAYTLMKCLEYDMCTSDHNRRAATALVSMVKKNWFDDAIGRVEGCEIFRGLMMSVDLRSKVIRRDIVPTLVKILAGSERNQTRMSLICIDVLDKESPLDLNNDVEERIADLNNEDKDIRMKGVKVISALAQTMAGERAIKQRLKNIIEILPPQGARALSRSQIVGAIALLYNLSKNETLREAIQHSPDFIAWKARR